MITFLVQEILSSWHEPSFRNGWFMDEGRKFQVYIRKSHIRQNILADTPFMDLANFSVEPQFQSRGIFTLFLAQLELAGIPLYVESIMEPRLVSFLSSRGYELDTPPGQDKNDPPSMFYLPPDLFGQQENMK